jgi:hypothetical protein
MQRRNDPQNPEHGFEWAARTSTSKLVAGPEFLDAETGRLKSSLRRLDTCRGQNPRNERPEIPRKSPHRRPVRCLAGNIRLRRLDGGVGSHMRTRLHGNSLLTGKLTGNFAISTLLEAISERKASVPQPLLGKFPKKHNRDFFRTNRELRIDNRDLALDRRRRPFLTHLFFCVRTRSVLTDKFTSEDDEDVRQTSIPRALRRSFLASAP